MGKSLVTGRWLESLEEQNLKPEKLSMSQKFFNEWQAPRISLRTTLGEGDLFRN